MAGGGGGAKRPSFARKKSHQQVVRNATKTFRDTKKATAEVGCISQVSSEIDDVVAAQPMSVFQDDFKKKCGKMFKGIELNKGIRTDFYSQKTGGSNGAMFTNTANEKKNMLKTRVKPNRQHLS